MIVSFKNFMSDQRIKLTIEGAKNCLEKLKRANMIS